MSGTTHPAALGKYEVRGTLGRGAMGTVYDGWDPVIDRRVAIKTVRLPDPDDAEGVDGLARFKREAQAAGRLTHPNIVGVFDYGETNDVAYIVMEFVEGRSLKDIMSASERMSSDHAVRLMEDVLSGLAYSHERGVVHRDIKPANIMMTRDDRAKIADFGIARIEASSMTQAGTVLGTPAYMSPEQFMGQVVDRRTDIYSCGVMLYQLLTGERPFDGSMSAIMHKALTTTPPRPSELSVTAPPGLDGVVARAMARRPEDRFETAAAFAQALRQPMTPAAGPFDGDDTIVGTVVAQPPRPASPAPSVAASASTNKPQSRLPVFVGGGLAAVAVAAVAVWVLLPAPPVATVPPPAQSQTPAKPPPVTLEAAQTPPSPDPAPVAAAPPRQMASIAPPVEPVPPPAAPVPTAAAILPPPPPPPAVHNPAVIDAALAASLPSVRCTAARANVADNGAVTVGGIVGAGAPEEALRRAVAAASPASIVWQVQPADGPYCPALDVLRPVLDAGNRAHNGLDLAQAGGAASLVDNDVIGLQMVMPGFAGFLHVTYLQHDATVSPLVPGAGYPAQTYGAHARIELGQPRSDFPGWRVGPPFGADMIVVVASTAPLFAKPLPDSQSLDGYLKALQAAIDALRRRGGSVAANALVLDTRASR